MKSILLIISALIVFVLPHKLNSNIKDVAEDVFGSSCGYIPIPPKLRREFYSQISNDTAENKRIIIMWLESDKPEKQLYAIEAVYCIEDNSDYKFSKKIHEKIDRLRESEKLANVCQGCVYDKEEMKEVIKKLKRRKNRKCDAEGPSF